METSQTDEAYGRSGNFKIGVPIGGRQINRADVADFIIKELSENKYIRKSPTIAL